MRRTYFEQNHRWPELYRTFHELVWTICEQYPASVTSGYRTEARNRAVGGYPNSFHKVGGLAVDVVCDHPDTIPYLIAFAKSAGLEVEESATHIHLELDPRHWPKQEDAMSQSKTLLGSSITKTADRRDATPPTKGAARDAILAAAGGWAAAAVLTQTGSPELAHAADLAMQSYVPQIFGIVFGGLTFFRKSIQEAIAR